MLEEPGLDVTDCAREFDTVLVALGSGDDALRTDQLVIVETDLVALVLHVLPTRDALRQTQ